tara:strand:+ start:48 stop:287 length:240 start_codon:yes stop_codon:yes gene_type:complete
MRKKGSGRTKGATSFVKVSLGELNRVLREDATVIVSRRYAEQLELARETFSATTKNIEAHAKTIEVEVHEPVGLVVEEW